MIRRHEWYPLLLLAVFVPAGVAFKNAAPPILDPYALFPFAFAAGIAWERHVDFNIGTGALYTIGLALITVNQTALDTAPGYGLLLGLTACWAICTALSGTGAR